MMRIASILALGMVFLLTFFSSTDVEARSNGILSSCDLSSINASGLIWPNGRFGNDQTRSVFNNGTLVKNYNSFRMPWAVAPSNTSFYTLRSGDGSTIANDPKTYVPDQWNEIHLRVTSIFRRWIGLVLYASTGNITQWKDPDQYGAISTREDVIGQWTALPTQHTQSITCNVGGRSGNVVTHTDAEMKPLHTRFWFKAPKGTGKVIFRILLKQGEQNKGAFYYPNLPLTLNEGSIATAPIPTPKPGENITQPIPGTTVTQTVIGDFGQSCADTCSQQQPRTPYCHTVNTKAIADSSSVIASSKSVNSMCGRPQRTCPYAGVSTIAADNTCFFRDTTNTACPVAFTSESNVIMADVCFTAAHSSRRPLCVCTNTRSLQAANPFTNMVVTSSSSSSSGGSTQPSSTASTSTSSTGTQSSTSQTSGPTPTSPVSSSSTSSGGDSSSSSGSTSSTGTDSSSRTDAPIGGGSSSSSSTALGGQEDVGLNTASRTSSVTSTAIVALVSAFGLSRSISQRVAVFAMVALLSLTISVPSPVEGHNYFMSLHRSREAAVITPCQKRIGSQPHVQVVADQEFEVEWSLGHAESWTYFALVREADLDSMSPTNISAMIDDYLAGAPGSDQIPTHFNKHHLRSPGSNNMSDDPKIPTYDFFQEWNMSDTHPDYFRRDPVYDNLTHPGLHQWVYGQKPNILIQNRFWPNYTTMDRRNSYDSAKYPFFVSAAAIYSPLTPHGTYVAGHSMIMRWTVPKRVGPGNYVLFFNWYGYRDGVDINVLPGTTKVANRYGLLTAPDATPDIVKLDHCEYMYVPSVVTQTRRLDPTTMDASACINDCIALGWNKCSAVAVVRASNLPTTLAKYPNIPYYEFVDSYDIAKPCGRLSVHERMTGSNPADNGVTCPQTGAPTSKLCNITELSKILAPTDHVCYGLLPGRIVTNQVEEEYIFSKESEDPIFYGTCFQIDPWRSFPGIERVKYVRPSWKVGESKCIKCDFYANLLKLGPKQAVDWTNALTDVCVDCDLLESQQATAQLLPQMVGPNLKHAGREDL